jgi:replicative DNA helicase
MSTTTDISVLSRVLRRIDATIDGAPPVDTVPTGFPSLDKLLGGGLRRGDLVAVGGDVASGKSAFALALAIRAAGAGHRSAFLTAETSAERVMERALCIEGRARVDDVRLGALDDEARAAVGAAALRLRDAPLTLHEIGAEGADGVAAVAPRVPPPALLVVDGLQALAPGVRARDEELAAAVGGLKEMARVRDAVVVIVAQLASRDATRGDPRPLLADFGVLGAVSQQADVVLGVFRERMYAADAATPEAAELLVLKNRNGATGYADLLFYERHLRFEDMADPG